MWLMYHEAQMDAHQKRTGFILCLITVLGIVLRSVNVSPFKIYPDTYQNLLVAENIRAYHSVVGFLGENGMVYPDFFGWTRPLYALAIALLSGATNNSVTAAQSIALAASIAAIPLAYLFVKTALSSSSYGFAASLLTALSFNHVVWSGFIQTEAFATCILLLFFWLFFINSKRKTSIADAQDLLVGMVFALAVLTRYEYAILIIPLILYMLFMRKSSLVKIGNVALGFGVVMAMTLRFLFPLPSLASAVAYQLRLVLPVIVGVVILSGIVFIASRMLRPHVRDRLTSLSLRIWVLLLGCLAALILIYSLFSPDTWLFSYFLYAPATFFQDDFLLGITTLLGFSAFVRKPHYQSITIFCTVALILLLTTYFLINPQMQRYYTHVLPILLIPASYGLVTMIRITRALSSEWLRGRSFLGLAIGIIVAGQAMLTFNGIKNWQQGSWFAESYEESAAKIVKSITPRNTLALVSFPEPYYFFTKLPTHSLTAEYPYIHIDESLNDMPVVIVQDMGMVTLFPEFSNLLDTTMQSKRYASFWVHKQYRFADQTLPEQKQVSLYYSTIKELKYIIEVNKHAHNSGFSWPESVAMR